VDHIPMVRTGKRQVSLSSLGLDFQKLSGPVVKAPTQPH
jgi:hypothetical protein